MTYTTIQFSVNGHEFTVEPEGSNWITRLWENGKGYYLYGLYSEPHVGQIAAINYAKGLSNDTGVTR